MYCDFLWADFKSPFFSPESIYIFIFYSRADSDDVTSYPFLEKQQRLARPKMENSG